MATRRRQPASPTDRRPARARSRARWATGTWGAFLNVARLSRPHLAHRRGPVEADVIDWRLGVREQVPEARVRASLHRLDQNPPVGEAADAHAPDQALVRRVTNVVVENEPTVEQRAQRM